MVERLINFAARVGKVVDALPDTRMGRHIGSQLVRSGTSPAPNYEEALQHDRPINRHRKRKPSKAA
jgi:four helix bundle protein